MRGAYSCSNAKEGADMRYWHIVLHAVIIAVVAFGCGDDDSDVDIDTEDIGVDGGADTDTGTDSDTGTGSDSDTDTGATACPSDSIEALIGCVDQERYISDLETIAVIRPPGSDAWQDIQDMCADRLEQLGFAVERHEYGTGVNVIGTLTGKTEPEKQVIVSAHYDHIEGCPGADDNASGVAGALEVARVLSEVEFDRTLVVACWDEEELGLIGASYYAQRAAEQGDDIAVALVYEMIGYTDDAPNSQTLPVGFELLFAEQIAQMEANEYRADFVIYIADEGAEGASTKLTEHAEALGLPSTTLLLTADQTMSPLLADLRRSDHAAFWAQGYPAIMIGDTANFRYDAYHCAARDDVVSLLNHDFAANIIRATVATAAGELGF